MDFAALLPRLATTPEAIAALDTADVIEGYWDGRRDDPMPGLNRSHSYAHGWWTGMRDGGHRDYHPVDSQIVQAFLKGPNSPDVGASGPIHREEQPRLASGRNTGEHDHE